MKKFLILLSIFLIPVIIFMGIPSYLLFKSKENFYNIENIVKSKEKYLIGYSYHEQNYGFLKWKYLTINAKKEVWALGSSRVLQFRKNMFQTEFYNAGYTISSINDFIPFLKSIPSNKHPKYIIIGLDQWMFNSSFDALKNTPSVESWQNSFALFPKIPAIYKTVYSDLFAKNISLNFNNQEEIIHRIGLNAMMHNTGFRNDGSMYYGQQISKLIKNDTTANDYNYANTLGRIKQGNRRFQYGTNVNPRALLELDKLLKYCKKNQIIVVGFLPPFANKVYRKMIETHNYKYLTEIHNKIQPYFDKYNYEVYDFSKIEVCNSSDKETIDGFHGGELTYQKILITILNSGSILNQVSDINKLKSDLSSKKNNYIIYEN